MRILLLTHRLPFPPNRGDRIRSFHLLQFLAERGEVSLACPTEERIEPEAVRSLQQYCRQLKICPISLPSRSARAAASLALGRSATEGYFWHPQLAAAISQWSRQQPFDIVLCYCSGMFRYTRLPALAERPVVVDMVDVDSQKWCDCAERAPFFKRLLYRLESVRVRLLETEIAAAASAVTLVSEEECALFHRIGTHRAAQVVRNGVDLKFFSPQAGHPPTEPQTCCFVGVLNYPPNIDGLQWFVDEVWPGVRSETPAARLLIVGKSPVPSVRRLAAAPGVELHADVPDVRPYLARSAVAIAPMRFARGIQNKVLEAMSMEKAVVATPQSLEGLCVARSSELLEASSPADWHSALCSLFADAPRIAQIGRAARGYVEKHHCWSDCLRPLDECLVPRPPLRTELPPRVVPRTTVRSAAANGFVS